jgi:hypothetical protein
MGVDGCRELDVAWADVNLHVMFPSNSFLRPEGALRHQNAVMCEFPEFQVVFLQ